MNVSRNNHNSHSHYSSRLGTSGLQSVHAGREKTMSMLAQSQMRAAQAEAERALINQNRAKIEAKKLQEQQQALINLANTQQQQLSQLTNNVQTLIQTNTEQTQKITSLNIDVNQFKEQKNSLLQDMENLRQEIVRLNEQVVAIPALQNTINLLTEQVAKIQTQYDGINNTLEQILSALS